MKKYTLYQLLEVLPERFWQVTALFPQKEIENYLGHLWKKDIANDIGVLTDDYAPVDYYIASALYN